MMYWDGHGWGMGFGWLFIILFWIFVIAGSVILVRWIASRGEKGQEGSSETPLNILKKRYAKGEISREQFEQMKKDIS